MMSFSYLKKVIDIVKEESFRSQPLVNMTDDMVRVTITMPRNIWRRFKKFLLTETGGAA